MTYDFMTTEQRREIYEAMAKGILASLMKEGFDQWYNETFEDFITGDFQKKNKLSNSAAENLIKEDIKRLFQLRA